MNDSDVLIGVFYDCARAEDAFQELRRGGFQDGQIRVALCEADLRVRPRQERGRVLAGLRVGAVIGALAGAALAWLVAGLLVSVLLVAAECAAIGATLGALVGWAIDVDEARASGPAVVHLSRGIVTVRPDDRAEEAADILRRCAGDPALTAGPPRARR
jgi:hypothetical protein